MNNFVAPAGNATINSLRFNQPAGGTLTLGGQLTVATGGILITPKVTSNVVISGGSLTASGPTSTNTLADVVVIQGKFRPGHDQFGDRR